MYILDFLYFVVTVWALCIYFEKALYKYWLLLMFPFFNLYYSLQALGLRPKSSIKEMNQKRKILDFFLLNW